MQYFLQHKTKLYENTALLMIISITTTPLDAREIPGGRETPASFSIPPFSSCTTIFSFRLSLLLGSLAMHTWAGCFWVYGFLQIELYMLIAFLLGNTAGGYGN